MVDQPEQEKAEEKPSIDQVKLEHKFNYIGGPYAYKNSSKKATPIGKNNR